MDRHEWIRRQALAAQGAQGRRQTWEEARPVIVEVDPNLLRNALAFDFSADGDPILVTVPKLPWWKVAP